MSSFKIVKQMKMVQKKIKDLAEKRVEKLIVEVDYKKDEIVKIADDVYSLTIAANMTKNVSP